MFKFEINIDVLDLALLTAGGILLIRRYKRKHAKTPDSDPAVKAEMKDGDIVIHFAP